MENINKTASNATNSLPKQPTQRPSTEDPPIVDHRRPSANTDGQGRRTSNRLRQIAELRDNMRNNTGTESDHSMQNNQGTESEDSVASETQSFMHTYKSFQASIRAANLQEAEAEFVAHKRELVTLPTDRALDPKEETSHRYLTWALRQIRKRLNLLEEEEGKEEENEEEDEEEGGKESSSSKSEFDPDKEWKLYGIIQENDTHYLIAWKGVNPKNGEPWEDESTAKILSTNWLRRSGTRTRGR